MNHIPVANVILDIDPPSEQVNAASCARVDSGDNPMKKHLLSAALIALAFPAIAADKNDLGGQCCADLEERIAQLETEVVRKNSKLRLVVYGQVNRAILWHKIEGESNTKLGVDNALSPTRFGFSGSGKVGDADAGFILEIGATDDNGVTLRESAVYVGNDKLGRIWLGRTQNSVYNIAAVTLANTAMIASSLKLQPHLTTLNPLFTDDLGMNGKITHVVKYVSPTVAGFFLSASWSEEKAWDAALRFAGEFGAIKVAGGVGFSVVPNAGDVSTETLSGSLSAMHMPTGLFLTGSAGEVKNLPDTWNNIGVTVDRARLWGLQGGIEQTINSLGKTTFYGEYTTVDRVEIGGAKEDFKADFYGFGVVQAIDAASTSVYLGYRKYQIEDGSADVIMGGAVVKF